LVDSISQHHEDLKHRRVQDSSTSDQSQLNRSHVHSEESLRAIVNRLSRIEGHIRGIKTMVQESRSCPDVLIQVAAVRGALDRVARMILDEHLTECIARAAQAGNIEAEIAELKAALDRFLT
jgi:DNA-binding FrmR family transcriptional regulator